MIMKYDGRLERMN